ncbi:MAG: DNA polymerase I, partial [Desulfovibrio sp.]|nr:DNA polymerase I [Desulfovibrio sp.]
MSLKERLQLSTDPLLVMDGSAFIFRAFFTGRNMQRSDGFPTNILVGLARLLLKILREEQPRYFLFVRDGHGPTFRHQLYPEYKANREATPEDLVRQLEPVKRLVRALGLREEETKGFEADDCLATIAHRYADTLPVVLISGDKDLKQCLAPNVYLWNLAAKEEKIETMESFQAEHKVSPKYWPDVQALIGDSADNIPGLKGIGPKTALAIFAQCESLEDLRDHPEKLDPKLRKKLEGGIAESFKWRELTRLSTKYPLSFGLEEMQVAPLDGEALRNITTEFEMTVVRREMEFLLQNQRAGLSSQNKLKTNLSQDGQTKEERAEPKDSNAFDPLKLGQGSPYLNVPHQIKITRVAKVEDLPKVDNLRVACIYDTSKSSLHLAFEPFELGSEEDSLNYLWQGDLCQLLNYLKAAQEIIVSDCKALTKIDPAFKVLLQFKTPSVFDLGLACYLLRPEDSDYSWTHLEGSWALPLQDGRKGPAKLALALWEKVQGRLKASGLWQLYTELELPLIGVLAAMEEAGIALDL